MNFKQNSVFYLDLEKVIPNPDQPRKFFDEEKLNNLASSISQYGVLQPIVVVRKKSSISDSDDLENSFFEIIAGERRFRASKIANLKKIPAIIREGENTEGEKLELAIIENLQREDLNPIDKAKSFQRLSEEFSLTHDQIAEKMGKSREYISNALRILLLPENILEALQAGKISEGHTRPLLMLKEKEEDQKKLLEEILEYDLTVREAEKIARNIVVGKSKKDVFDPEIREIENKISDKLGSPVKVEKRKKGMKLMVDVFSKEGLQNILNIIDKNGDAEKAKLFPQKPEEKKPEDDFLFDQNPSLDFNQNDEKNFEEKDERENLEEENKEISYTLGSISYDEKLDELKKDLNNDFRRENKDAEKIENVEKYVEAEKAPLFPLKNKEKTEEEIFSEKFSELEKNIQSSEIIIGEDFGKKENETTIDFENYNEEKKDGEDSDEDFYKNFSI